MIIEPSTTPDFTNSEGFPETLHIRTASDQPARVYVPAEVAENARTSLERVTSERETAMRLAEEARNALSRYKDRVRAKAIEVSREQEWCRAGLNDALRELELEPMPTEFRVEVLVTAQQRLSVTIYAADLESDGISPGGDGVRDYVEGRIGELVSTCGDPGAWEVLTEDVDIQSIEGVTD